MVNVPSGVGSTPWYSYPITHGYIPTYQGPGTDTPHWAYDLGTPFHTALTAPIPGTVKTADYQSWGGEVFIQPDNTNLPEYYMYHLDTENVHAGDHVNAGDFLGLSGGELVGQEAGAQHPVTDPAMSTGAHTHIGWFLNFQSTPIGGRPYGPDPAQLLAAAQGTAGTITFNPDTSPTGGPSLTDPTGLVSLVQNGASNLFMRLGVGVAGLLLIGFGVFEVTAGLRGESGADLGKDIVASGKKVAVTAAKVAA